MVANLLCGLAGLIHYIDAAVGHSKQPVSIGECPDCPDGEGGWKRPGHTPGMCSWYMYDAICHQISCCIVRCELRTDVIAHKAVVQSGDNDQPAMSHNLQVARYLIEACKAGFTAALMHHG